ncbi:PREDICTED: uncharacterized oxidoreductase At4g09670 [Tarenaya hassleriana]|uniref:uncharacterized oxidoreductase At4g09670 n=1 Tax=Tarenaya hassleriana TaxID=28532 RepID=UPI00053C71CE|nr:PREDICTED: uncharacterized oxidoreductase At4g09670 [Tarenaya hassleriana]
MTDKTVRFGILGCAVKYASKFVRTVTLLSPNAVILAVGDPSLETAKNFAVSNGLSPETVAVYGSYEEVLDDERIDAVYLPLPVTLRGRWAVAAGGEKKHMVVEKPPAIDAAELESLLEACESNGVQFMDGAIWLHHQRTARIEEMVFNSELLGDVRHIYSTMTTPVPEQALERLSKDAMGSAGAIGELGWYPIGAVLWAMAHELPTFVMALPSSVVTNSSGAILACSASLHYAPTATATVHCSFLSHLSTELAITGSKGSIWVNDYVIPYEEDKASFEYTTGAQFVDMHVGWNVKPEKVTVECGEMSQEVMMLTEFVRLVGGIKSGVSKADRRWPEISRKTQLVIDAVKKSVDVGCKVVYL